jgi:molybdenum cofactor cytidylyltransferase
VLQAVVLAAGESRRMGSPKALLPDPEGRPFIARIVRTLLSAGLTDVLVVTGSQHDAIAATLADEHLNSAARLVRNTDPARGQLSSIWTALDSCRPDAEGLLMTLVDVPMITSGTVRAVIETWSSTRAPVVRPIVDGRRGHPVIFDRRLFDELRGASLESGARIVVRAHWDESVDVPVDDPGSVADIDTPAEYERLRNGYTSNF